MRYTRNAYGKKLKKNRKRQTTYVIEYNKKKKSRKNKVDGKSKAHCLNIIAHVYSRNCWLLRPRVPKSPINKRLSLMK